MKISQLNEKLAFAPQIFPEHVAALAEQGFEQMICNRPDEEAADQPNIDSIRAEAEKQGIDLIYAPVANSQFTSEVIEKTSKTLKENKKTLMFCRSGTRCSILWAIIQIKQGAKPEETFAKLVAMGYDIIPMQELILSTAHAS